MLPLLLLLPPGTGAGARSKGLLLLLLLLLLMLDRRSSESSCSSKMGSLDSKDVCNENQDRTHLYKSVEYQMTNIHKVYFSKEIHVIFLTNLTVNILSIGSFSYCWLFLFP